MCQRRRAIHHAAIAEFSARGFAGTSMAHIAATAGVSRPALYQYFANKGDIFASAFVALFSDHVDLALANLNGPGSHAECLDGLLQGFEGDLYERMAASPHAQEIMDAKVDHVADQLDAVIERLWQGVDKYLGTEFPGSSASVVAQREAWTELLHFAPKGFKLDQPSIETFRRRLRSLAASVAADLDRTPSR